MNIEVREKHLLDEIYQLQVKIEKLEKQLADSTPNSVIKETKKDLEKQYKEELGKNSIKAFILKCQLEILEKILKI